MKAQGALAALVGGVLAILMAYASAWLPDGAPHFAVWAMIVGSSLVMCGMLALGALRSRVRPWRVLLLSAFLLLVMLAGFGLPVLLPPESANGPLLLGLPLRAAIEIYGIGLFPALFLPLIFALEFRSAGLEEASLAALRDECARLRRGARQA